MAVYQCSFSKDNCTLVSQLSWLEILVNTIVYDVSRRCVVQMKKIITQLRHELWLALMEVVMLLFAQYCASRACTLEHFTHPGHADSRYRCVHGMVMSLFCPARRIVRVRQQW